MTMPYGRHFGYKQSHFGADTKGHDLKAFGDTTGKYVFWDASADTLYVVGSLHLNGVTFSIDDIAFADAETLTFGTGNDVSFQWDGTNFIITAAADDSLIEIGDSAATQKSFDLKWYGGTANGASYLYFDASADLIYTTGVDLQFKDNDVLAFGTGAGAAGDVSITWDGTNLIIATAADDSLIEIGDSAATQKSLDLKWYGNENNGASYLYFDASGNLVYTTGVDLQFKDNDILVFGSGSDASGDVNIKWDATNLVMATPAASAAWLIGAASHVINATLTGTLTVGVDDTGYDVEFFGATAGCSMLWDESKDQLVVTGSADVPALKLAGAGSISGGTYTTAGAAWAADGTPALVQSQKYVLVDIGGTVYRIPLFANS